MLREKLMQIERGMSVVDKNNNTMGSISMVYFSDEDPDAPGPETISASEHPSAVPNWVNEFVQSFDIDNDIPTALKQRLHRQGFIRIHKDNYLGDKDYFVPLNQISNVVNDTVILNVAKEQAMDLG